MAVIVPASTELFEDFLENYPLYRKLRLEYFSDLSQFIPYKIDRNCPSCGKEQPFLDCGSKEAAWKIISPILEETVRQNSIRALPGSGFGSALIKGYTPTATYRFEYRCAGCKRIPVEMWVYVARTGDDAYIIFKVGQLPELDIIVTNEMRKALLAEDIGLYKRAKISINNNFGIGACIYLRRLVENHINPLLEAHLEKRIEERADESEIQSIRTIMAEKRMDEKIRLVTTPHEGTGINPVGKMYKKLSHGIHTLNDDECTGVAQAGLHVFEDILVGLGRRRNEEAMFKEKMKVLEVPPRLDPQ